MGALIATIFTVIVVAISSVVITSPNINFDNRSKASTSSCACVGGYLQNCGAGSGSPCSPSTTPIPLRVTPTASVTPSPNVYHPPAPTQSVVTPTSPPTETSTTTSSPPTPSCACVGGYLQNCGAGSGSPCSASTTPIPLDVTPTPVCQSKSCIETCTRTVHQSGSCVNDQCVCNQPTPTPTPSCSCVDGIYGGENCDKEGKKCGPTPTPVQCAKDQKKCQKEGLSHFEYICDASGNFQKNKRCDFGCDTENNCVKRCTPGEKSCAYDKDIGNYLSICSPDGSQWIKTQCSGTCDKGKDGPQCFADTKYDHCDNNKKVAIRYDKDGNETRTTCTYGCSDSFWEGSKPEATCVDKLYFACTSDPSCASGSRLVGTNTVNGSLYTGVSQCCNSGESCDKNQGICAPSNKKDLGKPCKDGGECSSGYCYSNDEIQLASVVSNLNPLAPFWTENSAIGSFVPGIKADINIIANTSPDVCQSQSLTSLATSAVGSTFTNTMNTLVPVDALENCGRSDGILNLDCAVSGMVLVPGGTQVAVGSLGEVVGTAKSIWNVAGGNVLKVPSATYTYGSNMLSDIPQWVGQAVTVASTLPGAYYAGKCLYESCTPDEQMAAFLTGVGIQDIQAQQMIDSSARYPNKKTEANLTLNRLTDDLFYDVNKNYGVTKIVLDKDQMEKYVIDNQIVLGNGVKPSDALGWFQPSNNVIVLRSGYDQPSLYHETTHAFRFNNGANQNILKNYIAPLNTSNESKMAIYQALEEVGTISEELRLLNSIPNLPEEYVWGAENYMQYSVDRYVRGLVDLPSAPPEVLKYLDELKVVDPATYAKITVPLSVPPPVPAVPVTPPPLP